MFAPAVTRTPVINRSSKTHEKSFKTNGDAGLKHYSTATTKRQEKSYILQHSLHYKAHGCGFTLPGACWVGFTAGHKNVWRLDTQSSLTVPMASACNMCICVSPLVAAWVVPSWRFRLRWRKREVAEGQARPGQAPHPTPHSPTNKLWLLRVPLSSRAVQSMERLQVQGPALCHSASPNPQDEFSAPRPISHTRLLSLPPRVECATCNLLGRWNHFCFLPVPLLCWCLSLPPSSSALSLSPSSLSLSLSFSPTCTLLLLSILIQADILRRNTLHTQVEMSGCTLKQILMFLQDRSLVFCYFCWKFSWNKTTSRENQLKEQSRRQSKFHCALDSALFCAVPEFHLYPMLLFSF